jgi:hypothetical protein
MAASWNLRTFNFHGGVYNHDSTPAEDGSVRAISQLQLTRAWRKAR